MVADGWALSTMQLACDEREDFAELYAPTCVAPNYFDLKKSGAVILEPGAALDVAGVLAAVVTGSIHTSRSRHQLMTTVKGVVLWWRTIAGPGGRPTPS
jgi:hypothetical protein